MITTIYRFIYPFLIDSYYEGSIIFSNNRRYSMTGNISEDDLLAKNITSISLCTDGGFLLSIIAVKK